MDERLKLAKELEEPFKGKQCFIGFDGVTDDLLDVVKVREGPEIYQPIDTLKGLGTKILNSAGKSCNLELVEKETKLGGNGPIMANALIHLGQKVIYAGTIGNQKPEPIFSSFAKNCEEVILLGNSASTQALEFTDGKVMLGKLAPFNRVTWEAMLKRRTLDEWKAFIEGADMVASVNWTMLLHMDGIWEGLLREVVPSLSKRKRWFFVDLADPAKRKEEDLKKGLVLLSRFASCFSVVLGLNDSEQSQVAKVLGVPNQAESVRKKLGIAGVTCHAAHRAEVAMESFAEYLVPTAKQPKVMTGAGDNFNGGFCLGLLEGKSPLEALILGIGTASHYVRHGKSPERRELAAFLRLWHNGAIE